MSLRLHPLYLVLLIFVVAFTSHCERGPFSSRPRCITFQKTFGGDVRESGLFVQQTSDGGYVIAGEASSFGEGMADFYLFRLDSLGDTLWTRTYGGPERDESYCVRETSDGGFIMTGWTSSFGAGRTDVYLVKVNSSGDTLWTRTYGDSLNDGGFSVQLTSDGGYMIVGRTRSFGKGRSDVYMIKTDSLGDAQWSKVYGGPDNDGGLSVQQTSDGGYVITGPTLSFGWGFSSVYLIRTDSLGDTLWTRTYGGSAGDGGFCLQLTPDGGYVIVGRTESFGAGLSDVYLIKTDSAGDTLWTRTYGGDLNDGGLCVQVTSDGGFIIGGWTFSYGKGSADVYLVRTDSLGDTLWTRTHGGSAWEHGFWVEETSDGGFILVGTTKSFGLGERDIYLIKTDENGRVFSGNLEEKATQ